MAADRPPTRAGSTLTTGAPAPRAFRDDPRDGARSPTLAQYLKSPAPYGKLLPQRIDDRGAGYRVWFQLPSVAFARP